MIDPNSPTDLQRDLVLSDGKVITVQALIERVSILEPGMVLMREVDRATPDSLRVMTHEIERVAEDFDAWVLVLDLSDAKGSITAEYRKFIPKHFEELYNRSGKLRQVGVALAGNPIVRVISKFLIGRITNVPYSMYKNIDVAVESMRVHLK